MGKAVMTICILAFCHLNLPVIMQYFCCCRFLTVSATAQAREDEKVKNLEMAADAEENEEKLIE